MNLRTQLLLIGGLFLALQLGFLYFFLDWGLVTKISQLEQELLEKNLTRGMEILQREFIHLEHTTQLWASLEWIRKSVTLDHTFSKATATDLTHTMAQQELNLLYILDNNQTLLWGNILALDTLEPYPSTTFLLSLWKAHPNFLKHTDPQSVQAGIYNSTLGPMLVVSVPIINFNTPTKIAGVLITGKLITTEMIKMLQTLAFSNIKIWPLEGATLSQKLQEITTQLSQTESNFLVENMQDAFLGYVRLTDLKNESNILISSSQPRDFTALINHYSIIIVASFIILKLFNMAWVSWSIRKRIILPLHAMTVQLTHKSTRDALLQQLDTFSWGELAALSQALAEYLRQMQEYNIQQCHIAYRNGLSTAYHEIYEHSESILESLLAGCAWFEEELRRLPTDKVEWLLAESKVSRQSDMAAYDLPERLEPICRQLEQFEKNMHARIVELHNLILRNDALLRLHTKRLAQIHRISYSKQG